MQVKEFEVSINWGTIRGQVFGDLNEESKPIFALHGHLDNSNSFKPLAEILTKHGYYFICPDLPGHGFSSHLPNGLAYGLSVFLCSIRKVIQHFNLNQFILMGHSYGSSLSLMYASLYPNQINCLISLDWITHTKRSHFDAPAYWREVLHNLDVIERKQNKVSDQLSSENALTKLLKENSGIDEKSGNILLERGLIIKDKKVQFSRDLKMKIFVNQGDFHLFLNSMYAYISCPLLFIYVMPPTAGKQAYKTFQSSLNDFHAAKKSSLIKAVEISGTHHVHMIESSNVSTIILEFFNEIKEKKLDHVAKAKL